MRSNGNNNVASNFVSFAERLKSFSKRSPKWPHSNSFAANPDSLAAAGFYFNPSDDNKDAVSCFICHKGLADWDPSDDPAVIHSNKCLTCPWAILKCTSDTTDSKGRYTFSSARLPSSGTMENARLETFAPGGKSWWPHDARNKGPSSNLMAQAGFIFTPTSSSKKDDTCSCIYCGIELGGWQLDDDPMEEHRRRQDKNGTCPFFTIQSAPAKPQPTVNTTNTLSKRNTASRSKSKHKPTPSVDETSQPEPEPEPQPQPPVHNLPPKKRSVKSKSRETQPTAEKDESVKDESAILPAPPKKKITKAKVKAKSKTKPESRSKPLPLDPTPEDIPISAVKNPDPVPQLEPEVDIEPEPELEVELEYEPEVIPEVKHVLEVEQEVEVEVELEQEIEQEMEVEQEQEREQEQQEPEVEREQEQELAVELELEQELEVKRKLGDNERREMMKLEPLSEPPPPTTSSLVSVSIPPTQTLTEAERAMTVEQWIRAEMDRQYELLKTHGRSRIEAFKLQALEVAKRIEQL